MGLCKKSGGKSGAGFCFPFSLLSARLSLASCRLRDDAAPPRTPIHGFLNHVVYWSSLEAEEEDLLYSSFFTRSQHVC